MFKLTVEFRFKTTFEFRKKSSWL